MQASLTEAVLEFKNSGKGLEQLVQRVGIEVYSFPRRTLGWEEDDCSEFFCYFYPKVPGLIARFKFTGKPFEAFLTVTLKWQLKTYATRRNLELVRRKIICSEGFWGQGSGYHDPEPDCDEAGLAEAFGLPSLTAQARRVLKIGIDGTISDASAKKRLLILVLKSALRVPAELVERVARLTGYETAWIDEKIEALRARTEERRVRLTLLQEKRNGYFFKLYCLQEQLCVVVDDPTREELVRQMLRTQSRLTETISEIAHLPFSPTHRDIAEVLHVPKGSVDSGLYYLKCAFDQLYPGEEIRYA